MQIALKQKEIEAAIKGFIAKQGISLKSKDISMVFTSGRKDNGISVEIHIEDDGTAVESYDAEVPAEVEKKNSNPDKVDGVATGYSLESGVHYVNAVHVITEPLPSEEPVEPATVRVPFVAFSSAAFTRNEEVLAKASDAVEEVASLPKVQSASLFSL